MNWLLDIFVLMYYCTVDVCQPGMPILSFLIAAEVKHLLRKKDFMSSNSTFFCDRCGAANRPEARFCRACGQALGGLDTTTDTIVGLGARGISSAHAVHGTSANMLNTNVNTTFQLPIGSSTITGLLQPQHMLKQRYIILANVGKGGFGAVYKALDSQFGNRLVAVKEMSQNSLDEKDRQAAADAFQHEA